MIYFYIYIIYTLYDKFLLLDHSIHIKININFQVRHVYICDFHKMMIQCARTKRRRKDSEEDSNETDTDIPEVELYNLQVNTLRRYKRHYKVATRPGLNKVQLSDVLLKHFKTIPIKEKEIINFFIYTVKTNGNKLDQKNGLNNENA